jgi:hypothetical protein
MINLRLYAFLIVTVFCATHANAQGKYAGSMKKLMGITYVDSKKLKELKGWQFFEGSVITPIDDPEMMLVDVYRKGTTTLVLFSVKEDTASTNFTIADVLEITNIAKGWFVKTVMCREGQTDDIEIVALAKDTKAEVIKVIKQAWRCNRNKKRIEAISIKGITCINEGAEQF